MTAAKLNALIADAVPTSNLSLNSTTGTISNFTASTANVTLGTIPTLVSTTLVTTGTGTAAAPAIVPTGDTNTGLFFPAADTLAATTQGAERLRVDSSGNVGIGTSTSLVRLTVDSGSVAQYGKFNSTAANGGYLTIESSGTVHGDIGTAAQVVGGGSATDFGINARGSRNLILGTNNTERLRIDSSGRVGIGTTTPTSTYRVSVKGDASSIIGATEYDTGNGDKVAVGFVTATSPSFYISNKTSTGVIRFDTNDTERLRITSGGEVYIAGTTDQGAYNLQVNGTGVWGAGAYVNGSDSRIKEDIQPLASGLDVVEKLNPVTYRYKQSWSSDQSIQSGFIAQELLAALDGQIYVNGVVQQGGAEGYYSVAYQNLIAVLTKAIQELKAENDSLKSRVSALEAA